MSLQLSPFSNNCFLSICVCFMFIDGAGAQTTDECLDEIRLAGRAAGAYAAGDHQRAFTLYRTLADCGDRVGQYHLGVMYEEGDGVAQNYAEASRLFLLAAQQGDSRAQLALGTAYANGDGVLQDFVKAHMWFNIAASTAVDDSMREFRDTARAYREQVSRHMIPAQLAKAQEMADQCIRSNYKLCG
jgi:TPR repeat protein